MIDTLLSPWVRRFLLEYLVGERSLARNTQKSYRDTLQQLLPFAARNQRLAAIHLHVSLVTSNVYAEVDLEMKAKALANCEVRENEPEKPWPEDKGLMEFLRAL